MPGRYQRSGSAHPALPPKVVPPIEHDGENFSGPISVDGNQYRNCIFDRCVLTYGGGVPPSFADCRFRGSTLAFVGAAANTLAFLKAMDSPKSGFQRIVRETFRGFTGS